MKRLEGKVAIVTGAGRSAGIGAAVCRRLAADGVDIFFTHFGPYDAEIHQPTDSGFTAAFTSKAELQTYGVNVGAMELDFRADGFEEALLNTVHDTLGTPSILINNAAYCVAVDFRQLTREILDRHNAVNITGTCVLSAAFAQRIAGQHDGRIVNFVSGQDKEPMPGNLAYVATKGALSAFTVSLATELASQGITVNAVDPGPTDSGWMTAEVKEYLLPKFPLGRIGMPVDVAHLVAFLASDEVQWITGQIIHSDGGFWD